jgi:DeoR/GlpR family transcriptional regulator of sugar metabolism
LNVDINDNISLHTENEIILTTTNGNGVINVGNNINLNSGENIDIEAINGKFELDTQKEIKINTKDTVKGIMIGTTTEGVPITIGSESSIVTIARDGLIFDDILYNNSVIPQVGMGVSNSLFVEWINHGKISNMNHLQLFISLAGLYDSGGVIGNINGEESHFGCFIEEFFSNIFSIKIECIETPSGGNPNISFQSHSSNMIQQGFVQSDMNELLTEQWMIDISRYTINLPRKDSYLYLTSKTNDSNIKRIYTAGKFIITFWSK